MTNVCKLCKHLMVDQPHECPSPEYISARNALVSVAAGASDRFGDDELEAFAARQRRLNRQPNEYD